MLVILLIFNVIAFLICFIRVREGAMELQVWLFFAGFYFIQKTKDI